MGFKMDRSMDQFQQQMVLRMNKAYGLLVKEINESLTRILQMTIGTAEELEQFLIMEVEEMKKNVLTNPSKIHQKSKQINANRLPSPLSSKYDQISDYNNSSYLFDNEENNQNSWSRFNRSGDNKRNYEIKEEQLTVDEFVDEKNHFPDSRSLHIKNKESKQNIERNKTTKMNKREAAFECDRCGTVFTQDVSLQRHIKAKHTNVRDFECTECDYATYRKDKLALHVAKHNRK